MPPPSTRVRLSPLLRSAAITLLGSKTPSSLTGSATTSQLLPTTRARRRLLRPAEVECWGRAVAEYRVGPVETVFRIKDDSDWILPFHLSHRQAWIIRGDCPCPDDDGVDECT